MKDSCEDADMLTSPNGKIVIRIGSKIRILKETGWTKIKLDYPYEGIVTELTEEWDNGERGSPIMGSGGCEDWGPNMITLGEHTFYPDENFSNIEVIEF